MTKNADATRKGLRGRLPLAVQREEGFNWRGEHVTRVEGFTDAVFAFAVTLLVVSLEVPRDFDGLLDVVRNFPAFVISFTLLMTFWNSHYRFHRRYGLEDIWTRVYTMAVIILTLFFVYPLKFLFTMLTVGVFRLKLHDAPHLESMAQGRVLFLVYGLGFAGVWGIYLLMHLNALRRRDELQLTPVEILHTKGSIVDNVIFVGVSLLSILLAYTTDSGALPGYTYMLLGPLLSGNGSFWGRRIRRELAARPA
jgi:uncharacterized membrane protein